MEKHIIFGLYDDETELLEAVKSANDKHLHIHDVLTPFSSTWFRSSIGTGRIQVTHSRLYLWSIRNPDGIPGYDMDIYLGLASDIWWKALLGGSCIHTHYF